VHPVIDATLDRELSTLVVRPTSSLEKADFLELAELADPWIAETGGLAGLVIDAPSFPGWDGLGAMAAHFRFVQEHQRHVGRIALVTNSSLGNVAERLASHFVAAEIRHFPAGELAAAKAWVAVHAGTQRRHAQDFTPMNARIPQLIDQLPELCVFVRTLARQIDSGELQDGDRLVRRIHDFYTPARMEAIEIVAPGWQSMASHADGATLSHITQALIALQQLPEYRQASPRLQALMEWIVLYHDVGKQVIEGQRDALHAFRSATIAALALPRMGFATSETYRAELDSWTRLVLGASTAAPDGKGSVQDNRELPAIIRGSERLFDDASGGALVVQAVLLHQSLNVVPEWPNPGSLTDAELPLFIRPALLPLLEALMLVDSDAWQIFDPVSKAKFRQSTLAVFASVRRQVGA
jgi:hypothetical protein